MKTFPIKYSRRDKTYSGRDKTSELFDESLDFSIDDDDFEDVFKDCAPPWWLYMPEPGDPKSLSSLWNDH